MAIGLAASEFATMRRCRASFWKRPCGARCHLLRNPGRLERDYEAVARAGACLDNIETLKAQRLKLQHVLERLIDGFTEGVIEKDQFTSRVTRTKSRIAELDTKIKD